MAASNGMTPSLAKERAIGGARGQRAAFERIRDAILQGHLRPAEHLVEQQLAERYSVTRGSIRQALFDLTAEGLVERVPNRGCRVRVVTVDEAVAITEVRMELEGLCAEVVERFVHGRTQKVVDSVAVMAFSV